MARKGVSYTSGFSGRTIGKMIKGNTGLAAKSSSAPVNKKNKK